MFCQPLCSIFLRFLSISRFSYRDQLFVRIIRAFLVEEQKIVKKVLKIQKAKEKQASKQ